MIEPREAWQCLEPHLEPLPLVEVERQRSFGHVLARDLSARVDVPAMDTSAMDGYALRGEVAAGQRLPVGGTVAAGDAPGHRLGEAAALRIMTGAPVPEGADRVVPVEHTDGGAEQVAIERPVGAGANIRRRAEVLAVGDPLLAAHTLLTPSSLALLATHGIDPVPVIRSPRVAVLTTGDEVVPPETEPGPGQLRDSHTDFLCAAGASLGLAFEPQGIAPDEPAKLAARIEAALDRDVLLLTGGVSMGEFDLVEEVLGELGYDLLFERVAIKPGKPLVAAAPRHGDGALVFGLPGNPASVMVTFWLFVRPALRRLLGVPDGYWHGALAGELAAPLPGAKGRDVFLPASVRFGAGRIRVTPHGPKGSHDLASYAHGTALVRIPAHATPQPAGAPCEVLPLADWRS